MTRRHDRAPGSLAAASGETAPLAGRPHTLDLEPQLGAFAAGDVLSDVLRTVRLTGALFFLVEAPSPWTLEVPEAARLAPVVLPRAQHVVSTMS